VSEGVSDPPAQAEQTSASRLRFIVAAVLFFIWVGYLAYLALGTADPTVLSRPQLLVSTQDVIAQVDDVGGKPATSVNVQSVHYPAGSNLAGQTIEVSNLPNCVGWRGAGDYILPLIETDKGYQVAPLPRSPGFIGTQRSINPPRIYRLTEETRAQLEAMAKP
jgi:hypothetical protein